jgi:putative endonuclease
MAFFCYIVASRRNGTLYVGHSDDLTARISQHKQKLILGFTAKHGCDQLVWFCAYDTREAAFAQERRLKEWRRDWKLQLIETSNPDWNDLYWEACGIHDPSKPYVIIGLERPETHP